MRETGLDLISVTLMEDIADALIDGGATGRTLGRLYSGAPCQRATTHSGAVVR